MSGLSFAPSIETQRLVLRAHSLNDYDACATMWSDPGVTRFIGGKPATLEESWSRLLRYAGHWTLLGFGYWVVEEKASGQFAGEVGFAEVKREIKPSIAGMPECGWAICPAAQGQGFASEAVAGALRWADKHFSSRLTTCLISPDNLPSLRVAEKCGYQEFIRGSYKGAPTIQYRRTGAARMAP